MKLQEKFALFLTKHKDLFQEETVRYFIENIKQVELYDNKSELIVYLKKCDYFIEDPLLQPSMEDDCTFYIRDQYTLLLFEAYLNRDYYYSEYRLQLNHELWKIRRLEIIELSDNKCSRCGHEERLQVHHKKYFNGRLAWEYEDEYLECLCRKCHVGHHKKEQLDDIIKSFSLNKNEFIKIQEAKKQVAMFYKNDVVNYLMVHGKLKYFSEASLGFEVQDLLLANYIIDLNPVTTFKNNQGVGFNISKIRSILNGSHKIIKKVIHIQNKSCTFVKTLSPMDKFGAQTKIEEILFSKENQEKPYEWRREKILKVLTELQEYTYKWGKQNGIHTAINTLTNLIEK